METLVDNDISWTEALLQALSIEKLAYINLWGWIGLWKMRTQNLLDIMQSMSAWELSEVLDRSTSLPKKSQDPNQTYPLEAAQRLIAWKIAEMLNDTTSIS